MVPDIKKLIAGFLLFSFLATAFSLIFLNPPSRTGAPAKADARKTETAALAGGNAFAPKAAGDDALPSDASAQTLGAGTNLTRQLGDLLSNEVIRANEEAAASGLIAKENVPTALAVPKNEALASAINARLADNNAVALPRFDEYAPDSSLSIIEAPAADDFSNYGGAIMDVLDRTILSNEFQNILAASSSPNMESAYAATTVYGSAVRELLRVPTPRPLVEFHKRVIAVAENQNKLVNLALGDPNDPLKSLVELKRLEGELDTIIARDIANVVNETNRLRLLSRAAPVKTENAGVTRRVVEYLFGIERALAQGQSVPVLDSSVLKAVTSLKVDQKTSNTKNWLRRLWEWAQHVLLQQLKNQIIKMLEAQIVNWINGGGTPQFVTDWKGFLGKAFDNAAGAAIEEFLPELCYPFPLRASLRLTFLLPTFPYSTYEYAGCTLNQVVSNVKNFYNDFRSGGWPQYGVTFQTTGNYFGILLEGHDRMLFAGAEAQEAAKNKAIAGAGFLGSEICPSTGKPPVGNGCPNGEQPLVRTPGKVLGDLTAKALGSNFDLVVNANDIAGLVATVTNAALTRLVSIGVSSVSGAVTGRGLADNVMSEPDGGHAGQAIERGESSPVWNPDEETAVNVDVVETPGISEAQPARVDLMKATPTQSYSRHPMYDASKAIDWSGSQTYSDTYGGREHWWKLTLDTPEYIDAVHIVTFAGINVDRSLAFTSADNKNYTILMPKEAQDMQVNFAANNVRDASGNFIAANTIKIKEFRISSPSQLALSTVEVFRHLPPVINAVNIPATLTAAQATNFNPRSEQWITATYYPFYNNPQPVEQLAIKLAIADPSGTVIANLAGGPSNLKLEPGAYRFTYTVEVDGFASAPLARNVTVQNP